MILGLTGSLGSGKSTVARLIQESLPATMVIDADAIARQVLEPGGAAFAGVVQEFEAQGVVGPGGGIDRKALAAAAFSSPERLARLNELVHPAVRAEELRLIAEHRSAGASP